MRASVVGSLLLVSVLGAACRPAAPVRDRLVVAHASAPVSLQPNAGNEEMTLSVLSNVFEALVDFDAKLAASPGLAESWHNEDDTTWVFRLKDGTRFHDGTPVEAADVVRSIEWARSSPESKRKPELAEVESVTAVDARTVALKTRQPVGSLPHRLATISISKPAAEPGKAPLGTGPYRIVEVGPTRTVLELFDPSRASIRVVEFRVIPDVADRVRQLQRHEVDFVIDIPAESVGALRGTPGVRVATEPGLRVMYLGLDTSHAPTLDPRVRRAIALAIDRRAIVDDVLAGQAETVDQIIAPPIFGYAPGLPPHAYDPAEARRLLAAAGQPQGFAVTLDYMPRKYRAMDGVVASIAHDLADVGIRVEPRPLEPGPFFEKVERQDTSMFLMGWMSTGGDGLITYSYLLRSPKDGHGVDNGGGYANPALDGLLARAERMHHPQERQKLLGDVARIVHDDVPVVPLYRQADLYGLDAGLEFQPRVDRRMRARFLSWRAAP